MELIREQILEIILKATSDSDCFNRLIEIILNKLVAMREENFS